MPSLVAQACNPRTIQEAKQENHEFKTSLDNIGRPFVKEKKAYLCHRWEQFWVILVRLPTSGVSKYIYSIIAQLLLVTKDCK